MKSLIFKLNILIDLYILIVYIYIYRDVKLFYGCKIGLERIMVVFWMEVGTGKEREEIVWIDGNILYIEWEVFI